jgi:hypothetical protein
MKKIFAFILAIALVFTFTGCGAKKAKKDIFDLVERKYDTIVAACENKDVEALLAINGIKEVDIVDGYVLIYCKGAGIAPSSQDYGFYYSEENLPVGVFDGQIVCSNSELVEYENGYRYLDSGYNEFYTEHIKGNIYFYSAAF